MTWICARSSLKLTASRQNIMLKDLITRYTCSQNWFLKKATWICWTQTTTSKGCIKIWGNLRDYKCSFNAKLVVETDNFGGYSLINCSGKTIKCGVACWLVGKEAERSWDRWLVFNGKWQIVDRRGKMGKSFACSKLRLLHMRRIQGGKCVRLRDSREIKDGEELTTF